MTASGERYFAYGSNMDPDQMTFRGLSFDRLEGAVLRDHRLTFSFPARARWLGTAADVGPAEGESVEGALYRLTTDISVLDDWEEGYERVPVDVEVVPTGEGVLAWTYVAVRKRPPATPSEVYVGQMLRGARTLGLSGGYIGFLEGHLETARKELGDHVAVVRALAGSHRPMAMEELADAVDRPVDLVEEVLADLRGWEWVQAFNEPPVFRVPEGKAERSPWVLR